MQKVFISYSRKDIDFVRKLAGDLEKAGYDVWWDITDLQGGDDWVRQIPEAISTSHYVIVVLTPNSIESEWVRKEYTQALSLRKKIIPIMLIPSSVPFALNTINFVNFTTGEYADNYKKLLEALGYTGEPPTVAPLPKPILPPSLRKYFIPALLGMILLVVLIMTLRQQPVVQPTDTPTLHPSTTVTHTPETLTPTHSATPSATASSTVTATATQTPTATATLPPSATFTPFRVRLELCVKKLDVYTINVRSGPNTGYRLIGDLLSVRDETGKFKNVCLWFGAQIRNEENEVWYQVSPGQTDSMLDQYTGGWVLAGLLEAAPQELPVVTLTSTATPSFTATIAPTFTRTSTPTPTDTPTETPSPTETETPLPSDTPTP